MALTLVVLWCHQERERHFESIINFALVQSKRKAQAYSRERGQDAMAEGCHVNVEVAEWLDKAGAKPHLLLYLAQCCSSGAFVTGINLAARKRNLFGMVGKMCGTLSKQ